MTLFSVLSSHTLTKLCQLAWEQVQNILVRVIWKLGMGEHVCRPRGWPENCEGVLEQGTELYAAWLTTVSK